MGQKNETLILAGSYLLWYAFATPPRIYPSCRISVLFTFTNPSSRREYFAYTQSPDSNGIPLVLTASCHPPKYLSRSKSGCRFCFLQGPHFHPADAKQTKHSKTAADNKLARIALLFKIIKCPSHREELKSSSWLLEGWEGF